MIALDLAAILMVFVSGPLLVIYFLLHLSWSLLQNREKRL